MLKSKSTDSFYYVDPSGDVGKKILKNNSYISEDNHRNWWKKDP